MKIFIDSADTEKIRRCMAEFPVDGVTTNPSIIAREKDTELLKRLLEIRELVGDKILFVQATSDTARGMVRDAEKIKESVGGNLSVKIPANSEGLIAVRELAASGFSVTATAVYTPCQALLFGKAGADYVTPYLSHIDNMVIDCAAVVREMAELFLKHKIKTGVLGASFRVAEQVNRVVLAGADAVTVTPEMLSSLVTSSQSDLEVSSFSENWKSVFGNRNIADIL